MIEVNANAPIDLRNSDGLIEYIQEGESARIISQLNDGSVDIAGTAVSSISYKVYDEASKTLIRDEADASGEMDDAGLLTVTLLSDDNIIVGTVAEGETESHIVRFEWLWNDGVNTRKGIQEVRYLVQKLAEIVEAP